MSGGSEHDLDAGGAQPLELGVGAIQPEGDAARRLELLHRDKPSRQRSREPDVGVLEAEDLLAADQPDVEAPSPLEVPVSTIEKPSRKRRARP